MKLSLIALCLMVPGAAMAGTNFPALADYPVPNCGKGEKPADVPKMKNGDDPVAYNKKIQEHNAQIAEYNIALHDYVGCMNAYVANAQADMDLIRDKVNKSVAAGNAARNPD
jgi:hypothetical protein